MAKSKSTAIEKTSDEEAELANLAELGDFFDAVEVDGLEDVGGEDIKLALRLWNMRGLDKNGKTYPNDVFYDTISEDTRPEIECVFLLTRKSKRYDVFNNDTNKTEVFCQSADRITGTTEKHPGLPAETKRPCGGCPDDGWFRYPSGHAQEGKPYKRCGEQHTVVAVEALTQKPFLIRFKKTSLKPFRNYLMAHHVGGRVSGGKRGNIPLFAYVCGIRLENHESGNYALPVLTRGAMLGKEVMSSMHEAAKQYLDIMGEVLAHADKQDSKHTSTESDSAVSSADFADDDD